MKRSEFEALPITETAMFGSEMVWDGEGERWWIGLIDGEPHRRRFGPTFYTGSFTVSYGDKSANVRIPYQGEGGDRLLSAARTWGATYFNCVAEDLKVEASS